MTDRPKLSTGRASVLGALALLYAAQGVPFGFAAEYLPVVLREAGLSRSAIAAFGWLQLPWQLKPLWAGVADHPRVRSRSRAALLALQLTLSVIMAAYALVGSASALVPWCMLTVAAAFVAATQDVFVDAFAVRTLADSERGWGNSAQIAGYRVGMILGGGGMLALSGRLGTRPALVACGALIAAASLGAFALRDDEPRAEAPREPYRSPAEPPVERRSHLSEIVDVLRHTFRGPARVVALVALTYKLGIHSAAGLIKPMLVDAGWSREHIGALAVTLGAAAAVAGSLAGGALHRWVGERKALVAGALLHGAAVLPLIGAAATGCPRGVTTVAIAAEHFASGAGTTVLFAGLMTATHRERAALHYTVLTSMNALAIGLGSVIGAALGDLLGATAAYGVSAILCVAPAPLFARWSDHAAASAQATEQGA